MNYECVYVDMSTETDEIKLFDILVQCVTDYMV